MVKTKVDLPKHHVESVNGIKINNFQGDIDGQRGMMNYPMFRVPWWMGLHVAI